MRAQKHPTAKLVHLKKRARAVKLDVALVVLGAFGTDLELPRHKRNRRADTVDLGGEGVVGVVQGEHPITVATVTQHQKVAQKYSTEVTGNTSAKNSARASRAGHFSVLNRGAWRAKDRGEGTCPFARRSNGNSRGKETRRGITAEQQQAQDATWHGPSRQEARELECRSKCANERDTEERGRERTGATKDANTKTETNTKKH